MDGILNPHAKEWRPRPPTKRALASPAITRINLPFKKAVVGFYQIPQLRKEISRREQVKMIKPPPGFENFVPQKQAAVKLPPGFKGTVPFQRPAGSESILLQSAPAGTAVTKRLVEPTHGPCLQVEQRQQVDGIRDPGEETRTPLDLDLKMQDYFDRLKLYENEE